MASPGPHEHLCGQPGSAPSTASSPLQPVALWQHGVEPPGPGEQTGPPQGSPHSLSNKLGLGLSGKPGTLPGTPPAPESCPIIPGPSGGSRVLTQTILFSLRVGWAGAHRVWDPRFCSC